MIAKRKKGRINVLVAGNLMIWYFSYIKRFNLWLSSMLINSADSSVICFPTKKEKVRSADCVWHVLYVLFDSLLYFILLNLDYKESLAPFPLRLNITNHAATPTPMGHGAFLQLHWALLAAYQAGCFLPPPSKQQSATHRCLNPGGSLGPLVVRYFYTPGTVKCILLLFF